jgi:hypothetical protein
VGRVSKAPWVGIVVVVLAAATVVILWDRSGTASRLRREFGLGRAEVVSVEAIAAGIRRRLPLGSDRRAVELFLRQSLAGDENSMVEFVDKGGDQRGYLCTFGYDVYELAPVKETYSIWFAIDNGDVLRRISVAKSLTGL